MYLRWLTFIVISVGVVSLIMKAEFRTQGSLAGTVCPLDRRVFEIKVQSYLSCAYMAAKRDGSVGVSYDEDNMMCYGCDTFVNVEGRFEPSQRTVFFRMLNSSSDGYTDINGYVLEIKETDSITRDQASRACAPSGQLARIDTLEKQMLVESLLIQTGKAHTVNSLWIQERLDVDGIWKFDDGTPTPTSDAIWVSHLDYRVDKKHFDASVKEIGLEEYLNTGKKVCLVLTENTI